MLNGAQVSKLAEQQAGRKDQQLQNTAAMVKQSKKLLFLLNGSKAEQEKAGARHTDCSKPGSVYRIMGKKIFAEYTGKPPTERACRSTQPA